MKANKRRAPTALAVQVFAALFAITGCASAVPGPVPVATSRPTASETYEIGQTVRLSKGSYVAVFEGGEGNASHDAAGVLPGHQVHAYKVVFDNRTDEDVDLSDASMNLYYTLDGTSFQAPLVIDLTHPDFGAATGTMSTPVEPDVSSTGAWLFAVPDGAEKIAVSLTLESSLPSVLFQN